MDNEYYIDSILHHGILGQKWGVKNGPPYPLLEKKIRSSPALQRLKNAKSSNLDRWGKAPQHKQNVALNGLKNTSMTYQ